ncbi:MAG TPA: RNA 2',3'-cyclic phosphodiesterase [Acetivibrio saccincola]|uniref:RNA 2',3'-cyclic phosphodiesterase n=1 Tax=Acetivibrio saccincola TaxID=1677857 RepID=UPI002BD0717A|nr:RNA 2',3'-cyclic phosphodiesterase [Acetivibrio saccincola]HOA98016.1 RNA 2',3'-cyclic phosphodiesterase [Acetivibrio saccincola]HQD29596.1 RNA 2',3'-cyclic phosphodiesterase [Acetivibrio saccincola]
MGIDFNQAVKKELNTFQKRFEKYAQKGRWKHIDNFHITLKFLGEISVLKAEQIDNILKDLCRSKEPFNISFGDLGFFAGRNTIKALWFGISEGVEQLESLYKEIDKSLITLGFPKEKRKFVPHITIAQDVIFKCDFSIIKEAIGAPDIGKIPVDRLYLFKSEQIENKRVYTKISEYELLGFKKL